MAGKRKTLGTAGARPTGDMLTAHLLAMLEGLSAYGYDLAQRLNETGLGDYNKGTVYRALRQMEGLGLVSSMWDTSTSGPARRMYTLTKTGSLFLNNWLTLIDAHRAMLERFLHGGEPASARRPRRHPPVDDGEAASD